MSVTIAGLRARFARMALIALAIALGVGFVSGTFSLTDAMRTTLYESAADKAKHVAAHAEFTPDQSGEQPGDQSGNQSGDQSGGQAAGPAAAGRYGFTGRDLAAVAKVPGVAAVQPRELGMVQVLGPDGTAARNLGRADLVAFVAPVHPALNQTPLVAGRLPARRGELLLNAGIAARQHWQPGDAVQVRDARGKAHRFRLAGTVKGNADAEAVGLLPADFRASGDLESGWTTLDVIAAPGATSQEVATGVAAALGKRAEVITGAEYADRLADDAVQGLEAFTLGLLLFAGIALMVAAIVIYNTFTILLAQRQRELALLRCVGAARGQVFRGVMLESAVLGLLASVFGYVVGYGLAAGAFAAMRAFGLPLGEGLPVTASGTAAVAALLVGVAVTMLSALLPARGATRVAPVTALTSQPELVESRRVGRLRVLLGGLLMVGGAGVAALAAAAQQAVPGFGGGVLMLLGLLVLGPVLVTPVGRGVGWLPARLFGAPGMLAAATGARNPRRMAAATNALTLGVGLVCVFLVGAESTKASANAELQAAFPVDFVVSAESGKFLPAGLHGKLAALPQLGETAPVRSGRAKITMPGSEVTSAELDLAGVAPTVLTGHVPAGSLAAGDLNGFRSGTAVLSTQAAEMFGTPPVGSTMTVTGPKGRLTVRVVALVRGQFDGAAGGVILTEADHARVFGKLAPERVLAWTKSGVTAQDARAAVAGVTDRFPEVSVNDIAAEKAEIGRMIDGLLGVVAVLMALSIIIAVIGIGITLTLSVVERTRESGMLRALGLTRGQLYSTLLLEAVIMAVIAAVLGIVLGVGLGIAGTYSLLEHDGLKIAVPVGRIGLVVLGAAVAGVLAALLPARRSARVSPVAALAAE
jgi:putative ABC transport system permease protein